MKYLTIIFVILLSCKSATSHEANQVIGVYKSSKPNSTENLELTSNGNFRYSRFGELESKYFTDGNWLIDKNEIILNSKILSKNDSLLNSLVGGKRISFENKRFKISNNKY